MNGGTNSATGGTDEKEEIRGLRMGTSQERRKACEK